MTLLRPLIPATLNARSSHLFSFSAIVLALALPVSASAETLVIKGSDTLGGKLVPTLAEEYRARNPNVSFEIAAEGSTTGLAAIIDGTAHIGMSSRRARATEISAASARGVALKPTIVAHDGMAVIVNAANPLAKLTRRQVEQIFAGDVKDWSAVGGKPGKISIYTRNTASGTYSDWKDLAMKKRDYARSAQKMAGNEQIAAEVAKNPNGIGYVGLAYLQAAGIKTVPIDGVLPTKDTILNKKYAYARPTYYYTNGEPTGEAAKFVAFTLSDSGQKIAEKIGFVPVR
jgi:phosphate transport system substrate-binding protein